MVTSSSIGSMWMSLAPCLIARPRIELASRMIGASSDALIRSCFVSAAVGVGVGGELQLADQIGLQQIDHRGRVRLRDQTTRTGTAGGRRLRGLPGGLDTAGSGFAISCA